MNKTLLAGLLLLTLLGLAACPKNEEAAPGGTPTPAATPDGSGESATDDGEG
jgi:hypothetical protein